MTTLKKINWFHRALFFSLLLHVLFLGIAGWLIESPLFSSQSPEDVPPPEPLVFEFEQPEQPPEVIETPESARTDRPNPDARLASDKNARAQNEVAVDKLPLGEAYSEGEVDFPQMAEVPAQPQPEANLQEENTHEKQEAPIRDTGMETASQFSREWLTGAKPQSFRGELLRPKTNQRRTRAEDLGAFSLNTYAWDFAPYMLRLKRRIEKNIFPPPAFTYMGIISGQAVLRFRILPDGTLSHLEVLSYNGHKSLLNTSLKAVEVSAPFEPLPGDFPEKYLEVTGRFEYLTTNR